MNVTGLLRRLQVKIENTYLFKILIKKQENVFKSWLCPNFFSCCPKNLSWPKFRGAAAPLAPPACTPMRSQILSKLLLTAALKNFGWNVSLDLTTILEARRILRVVSHFNLSVLANETLSVSLCREIDNVFGVVRTCFDHVLSKFSGFSWERFLFLKSACVNMVMQIQVQIGDTRTVFLLILLRVLRI